MCIFLCEGAFKKGRESLPQHIIQFCESQNVDAYRALAEHGVWLNGIIYRHAHCAVGVIYIELMFCFCDMTVYSLSIN